MALIEIVSPAKKDRRQSVEEFVEKAVSALHAGCHLLIVDLFSPSRHDPQGIHGLIWEHFHLEDYRLPTGTPPTFAAYCAADMPEAYLNHVAIGDDVPSMPLFLQNGYYVNAPLSAGYDIAWKGVPGDWRDVLER